MIRKLKNIELNRLSKEDFVEAEKLPLVLVLDNIRSMQNVGSIFRTCDAFLVEKLYLCGITGTPPHKELHKTALGADDTVSWEYHPSVKNCVEELKAKGYHIAALEQAEGSIPLESFCVRGPIALILGNEVDGVNNEVLSLCDSVIEIPQHGTKHSLNVAVSAGIGVWEIRRQASEK